MKLTREQLGIRPGATVEFSGFARIEDLDAALPSATFERLPLPFAAGFLAGTCLLRYLRAGGARRSSLPDFYIGAHAAIEGLALLTRDAQRYRTYLPGLRVVTP